MSNEAQKPDFESLKQLSEYGAEYWSARELMKLLGYSRWENFDVAIKRAITACEQVGQPLDNHFREATKPIKSGKGGIQNVKNYLLSRFACYLIAQNGDPRKPEIAAAQSYFAISTHTNELREMLETQERRLELRERIGENTQDLAQAARGAGVLPRNFGLFEQAGYEGLYGGLGLEELKERKGIDPKEDLLDRMGVLELASNDFRVAFTADKLRREHIIGQNAATETHREVGKTVRKAIEEIGGPLPEDLPVEPSLQPLLSQKKRKSKEQLAARPDE